MRKPKLWQRRRVKPLDGIRVLDLSRVLAGPWATQMLADLGAEVIKVEQPGSGDDTRHWGPPWHEHDGEKVAAYFLAANRGKRSVAIDFSTAEGAALVAQDGGERRRRGREFQGRRAGQVRARRGDAARRQSAADLRLDHRLRAGRALCRRAPATITSSRRWAG